MPESPTPQLVHYLPLVTTVLSAIFFRQLWRRSAARGFPPHLTWWATGVFFYGVGTALESAITLFGNTVWLNKSWYVAGAILGGYPLAQGSVHLLLSKRSAWTLTCVTLPVVVVVGLLVVISPVNTAALEPHRPSGAIIGWTAIRAMTPFINGYAALFLIGGALWSLARWARIEEGRNRAIGNALIAGGAILPGVGGGFAKAGLVEALYIGELIGIVLIWAGYHICLGSPRRMTSGC